MNRPRVLGRTPSTAEERRIRRRLPLLRWGSAYLPRNWVRRFLGWRARHVKLPSDVLCETVEAGGVLCEKLTPRGVDPRRALFYLHGGGFVYGWSHFHANMVAGLVQRLGMGAVAPHYRLAPEHPFPEALDDCLITYRALLDCGIEAKHIALAGDSAGGNLVLAMLLALRAAELPLPGCAVCLSPVVNFTDEAQMLARGIDDALLHPKAMRRFRDAYAGKLDVGNPMLSPLHGDLSGLPPMLIHVGDEEILKPDIEAFASKADRAHVEITLQIWPRMWHAFQIFYPRLPQSAQALDTIATFVRKSMHTKPASG